LSEKVKREFRKANIGIACAALVLLAGFPFLYRSESAMRALGLGAFAVAMAVPFFLDWREGRVHGKRTRHRP